MEAKIKNGVITIKMALQRPKLSASGKSMVIATSRGKQRTSERVDGQSVFVVANAFVEVEPARDSETEKPRAKPGKKTS
jgi:hypothetical protein